MNKSTQELARALAQLSGRARNLGLTDTQWAARAGVRKETLSRLRGRDSCDFATLSALAGAVGAQLSVLEPQALPVDSGRHFPNSLNRDYERQLLNLCASRSVD